MQTFLPILYTVGGLILFEIISSIDNAVINAEILSSMPAKNRHWFLRWGLFFSVFGMRGVLPWLVVWISMPNAGPLTPLSLKFYQNLQATSAVEGSAELLLMAAGTALLLIFFYWIIVEHRSLRKQVPLRTLLFIILAGILLAVGEFAANDGLSKRAIAIGTIFFLILMLTKRIATIPRQKLSLSAGRRAKIVYLEVLDTIFSVEAVFGAFAFTFSVPLILIGNGIGAIIVRYATAVHGARIRKLLFLKPGAMYALGFIGTIMILDGLGGHIPGWLSFLTTVMAMGLAYLQR